MVGESQMLPGQKLRHQFSCWIAAVRTHYLVLLTFTVIVYFPRLCLSFAVFFLAQLLRAVARLLGVISVRDVANRRILLITDYMPPQTHGIAIRCDAYIKEMRKSGHEVVVFATANDASKQTSFDHPNIPSVVNPFNIKNRIGYNPGVKLAWFLGSRSWDVVHLVYPSLIGCFVLPLCAWRRIPVYCSHHVEMSMFARNHVPVEPIVNFGMFMYNLIGKWPATRWGALNSAPTLCFARAHLGTEHEERLRRVPSGTHDVFSPDPDSPDERQQVRLSRFKVKDETTKVALMVQRLSGEKGTNLIFPGFLPQDLGGEGIPGVLAIAGDGPSKAALMQEASSLNIPVVFLGNVPHHELPKLYRAADCFVTMSLSETFGLTCLEAQMCGCPAVMPFCDVFNEIWDDKVPRSWRYDIRSLKELASAIKAAQTDGRDFLKGQPIRMTWSMAAADLLKQYEECIAMMKKKRETLQEIVTFCDHLLRVGICTVLATWVLARYYMLFKKLGKTFVPMEWFM